MGYDKSDQFRKYHTITKLSVGQNRKINYFHCEGKLKINFN
jgi:hypothetical protein